MPRLLRVFRVRWSWQGCVGCYRGPQLLKKIACAENILSSAAPPVLPLFHGAESNALSTASIEATDLQE